MHLVQVPPDAVINGERPLETMWPMIAPLLQRAIDYSEGVTSLEETAADIMAKRKQLWLIVTNGTKAVAAAVSMLQKFESGVTLASIVMIGGENGHIEELLELRSEFETWAKSEGCNRVRFYGRKGWAKNMRDYKIAAYVMQKELT